MKAIKLLLFSFLLCSLYNCKEDKPIEVVEEDPVVSTFYFIRHAEKDRTDPENLDPELNQDGLGRAMLWAEILDDVAIDLVYTTDYERTSMTAAPVAVKKDISIQYYSPDEINIEEFKSFNEGKNVLVVGHSDTTPEFVNKMLGEQKYGPMDDFDNGSLFIVRLVGDKATDIHLKFN